jgi:hypothetical protein
VIVALINSLALSLTSKDCPAVYSTLHLPSSTLHPPSPLPPFFIHFPSSIIHHPPSTHHHPPSPPPPSLPPPSLPHSSPHPHPHPPTQAGHVREDGVRLAALVYQHIGKRINPHLEQLKPAMVDLLNQVRHCQHASLSSSKMRAFCRASAINGRSFSVSCSLCRYICFPYSFKIRHFFFTSSLHSNLAIPTNISSPLYPASPLYPLHHFFFILSCSPRRLRAPAGSRPDWCRNTTMSRPPRRRSRTHTVTHVAPVFVSLSLWLSLALSGSLWLSLAASRVVSPRLLIYYLECLIRRRDL